MNPYSDMTDEQATMMGLRMIGDFDEIFGGEDTDEEVMPVDEFMAMMGGE